MALRFGARVLSAAVRKPVVASPRFNFSVLSDREQGEEARYIRAQESDRHQRMRAEMERILALEDTHEDKKELVDILG